MTLRVVCGWCGRRAEPPECVCGRDPEIPWTQRGQTVPVLPESGRPPLDPARIYAKWDRAMRELRAGGKRPTVEEIAEHLDVSPWTVRAWQERFGLR